jgi:hypothetical protein
MLLFTANEVYSGNYISPLIRAPYLYVAAILTMED